MAKTSQVGTFQTALEIYAEQNGLQHDAVSGGFVQAGEGNVTVFPRSIRKFVQVPLSSLPMIRVGFPM